MVRGADAGMKYICRQNSFLSEICVFPVKLSLHNELQEGKGKFEKMTFSGEREQWQGR